jgi:Trk-type K+ transport system membrane component
MGVCVLGAVSLPLYLQLYRRSWRSLVHNEQLRALAAAITVAGGLIYVFQGDWRHLDLGAFDNAMLLAVSAQTTAGFATVPPADLSAAAKFVVIPIEYFKRDATARRMSPIL